MTVIVLCHRRCRPHRLNALMAYQVILTVALILIVSVSDGVGVTKSPKVSVSVGKSDIGIAPLVTLTEPLLEFINEL